jgi:hypothetical protein
MSALALVVKCGWIRSPCSSMRLTFLAHSEHCTGYGRSVVMIVDQGVSGSLSLRLVCRYKDKGRSRSTVIILCY